MAADSAAFLALIPVSQFMSMEVVGVPESMRLDKLCAFLVDHTITGARVLDADGRVVGVVSMNDVLAMQTDADGAFYEDSPLAPTSLAPLPKDKASRRVKDVMTRRVIAVDETAPIEDAARLLREHHVHRLLVTRDGTRVVGIITSFDLLRAVEVMAEKLQRQSG